MKTTTREAIIHVTSPMAPPYWALLERQVLDTQAQACQEFFEHYFDDRGYLMCVPRWGAADGPDDAAENLLGWTLLHAMGAPDSVLDLYRRAWEGHLRQYTEAKTVECEIARGGMYSREFPVMFDWLHNGEWLGAFVLQALSDPYDSSFQRRTRRYAGFYNGEDPSAPNYDPKLKIIRATFNGSHGPLLRTAVGLDWIGDPIEIRGRNAPLSHSSGGWKELAAYFSSRRGLVGDTPFNLATTALAFNAYALTGEAKYRDWLLEYVDAWTERAEANGGLIPTHVGLDGTIGGPSGKWWDGFMGWAFSFVIPWTGQMAHSPGFLVRTAYALANALMLTGDQRYVEVWHKMIDVVNSNARVVDGQTLYPRMYGDQGWYNFQPQKFCPSGLELYYWTLDREVLDLMPAKPRWIGFLDGEDPDYPTDALLRDLAATRERVEKMRQDVQTADTRVSDEPNGLNPAVVDALTQLMLGGLPTTSTGHPLHCRLRYFDPERRRAGIPEDVAALVDRIGEDEVAVTLVNLDQVQARTVIVQGGAYAEHQIVGVTGGDETVPVDHSHFAVELAPGAGSRLVIGQKRYANQPTLAFPWV